VANVTFPQDRLLTVKEVAQLTGLAVGSIYHLVSQSRIPVTHLSRRCIRFRYSDLMTWISSLTEMPINTNKQPSEK
jgi:excisionase family DNA binding protein